MQRFMPSLLITLMMGLIGVAMNAFGEEATNRLDLQMENVFFPSGSNLVHAFVYKPQGSGAFPVIIYNQATKDPYYLPGGVYPFEMVARWAIRHHYALFIPDRPGNETFGTTLGEFAHFLSDTNNISKTDRSFMEGFDIVGKDISAAAVWLTKQPFVDKRKLAMMGYSTGAMQTFLLATKPSPVRAFVVFSPASRLWKDSATMRHLLSAATLEVKEPLLLIQSANDFSTGPIEKLGPKLKALATSHRTKLFPPFGKTPAEALMFGVHGSDVWGDEVSSFLESSWN